MISSLRLTPRRSSEILHMNLASLSIYYNCTEIRLQLLPAPRGTRPSLRRIHHCIEANTNTGQGMSSTRIPCKCYWNHKQWYSDPNPLCQSSF